MLSKAFLRGSIALGATLLSGGCQTAHVKEPLTKAWAGNDPHDRSEFWYRLARQPVTSNDEAFHGVLLYVEGKDPAADFSGRVRELTSHGMLPGGFDRPADEAIERGTLAVLLVEMLKIKGGVTMHMLGPVPRYAVRALEYRGIFPQCSPNQAISGGEFVGIMQKAEEYERGNPADAPAAQLPGEIHHEGGPLASVKLSAAQGAVASAAVKRDAVSAFFRRDGFMLDLRIPPGAQYFSALDWTDSASDAVPDDMMRILAQGDLAPLFLDDAPASAPAGPTTAPAAIKHLNVIVTGVEGDSAEFRKDAKSPWTRARVGTVLHENAEFRTGPKSAIRFIIPPDQTFCLDSQGATSVLQAVTDGKKTKTDIGLAHGRMRYDLDKGQPVRIEAAGVEHDATIRGPNSALALRGTKVSLFDQPPFTPEAISLTGRATYINPNGQRVFFGGSARAGVHGNQTSAAEQASDRSASPQSTVLARADFENREVNVVIQRGGFVTGDVIVGDLHLSDFHKLPGALDFVLQWSGGGIPNNLQDLNLAVFSPLNSKSSPDFVANPPFLVSLNPNSPASIATRAAQYPQSSRSGGQISKNSVGPDGLELAFWPKSYPTGTYGVAVFNLLNAANPPKTVTDPVAYTVDVFYGGRRQNTFSGTVGYLQTSPEILVNVPASHGLEFDFEFDIGTAEETGAAADRLFGAHARAFRPDAAGATVVACTTFTPLLKRPALR